MMHRFNGDGLYILDEPEAALSPTRQMAMVAKIHQLINQKSQFIIATHSPIILSYPDALILELDDGTLTVRKYQDCEHYTITKDFLNNPGRALKELLG